MRYRAGNGPVRRAKTTLDESINNARGKFFKAIQIAEILHYDRTLILGLTRHDS